ncbi:MAG: helix-turn-helix domain-containing protein [Pseudonocardiaceae bacterium]|nr:helix-turn-helix domain-containing protein [Pseudonocardiaceae bacterium]
MLSVADETPNLIRDPKKLRAIAHPLRWKLIELIAVEGTATATRCAEVLGESVASCSYHLNMLAKYGYIEEAPGGQGREKPWQLTSYEQSWSAEGMDTEGQLAVEAVTDAFLDNEFARLRQFDRRRSLLPKEWREALGMTGVLTFLTAEETQALKEELREVANRYVDRLEDPSKRPEGSRPVRIFLAVAAHPGSTEPSSAQPGSAQPGSTQPGSTQPGSTQPGSTQPGSTPPDSTQR